MRIAIFDYKVRRTNPIGRCHLRLMEALCDRHEFTVFAPEFENPHPDRIRHVRVPTPLRPLVAQFFVYHLLAPVAHWWARRRGAFDLVMCVESNLLHADIVHTHFCHHAYARGRTDWGDPGLVTWLRRIDHMVRAWSEPLVYRSPKLVVVPSNGLRRELEMEFPHLAGRVEVIANPIDTRRLVRPADFDAGEVRRELGFGPDDLVLTFVALGHFERKGLPLVLDAMRKLGRSDLKLAVVGGRTETIASYRDKAAGLGLSGQVAFTGMRDDVRPWLWAADAFVFPSQYETFSLVSYEAAAAGLPIVVTKLHGVEDFARDGDTALVVERSADEVTGALRRLYAMGPEGRRDMGAKAAAAVSSFTTESFVAGWRRVLNELEARDQEIQAVGTVAP